MKFAELKALFAGWRVRVIAINAEGGTTEEEISLLETVNAYDKLARYDEAELVRITTYAPALLREAEAPAAPRESCGFQRGLVAPARRRSGATAIGTMEHDGESYPALEVTVRV